jgi:hypothetical protein
MLSYAVIVFAFAALGGLVLASFILRGKLAPWSLSLLHAGLGALGLVLVLMVVMNGAATSIVAALVILAIAALGGFYLASIHLKAEVAPGGVVMIHASAAVIGFLILAGAVLGML